MRNIKTKIRNLSLLFLTLPLLAAACVNPLGQNVTGGGVYRSSNFGVDWEKLTKATPPETKDGKKPKEQETPLAGAGVTFLKFTPSTSKKIYAGTVEKGLFYSDDGGDTWKQVLSGFIPHMVTFDPADEAHMFVGGKSGTRGKVVESKDAGKSWVEIFQDGKDGNSVRGIAINPTNPKVLALALLSGHIIRSTDGGETWAVTANLQDKLLRMEWLPGSPLFVLGSEKGVFISKDAGVSFTNISESLWEEEEWEKLYGQANIFQTGSPEIGRPIATVRKFNSWSLAQDDPKRIYVATDQGLFVTNDEGKTWKYMTLPIRTEKGGLGVNAVAQSAGAAHIYAGLGNVVYFSQNFGASWQVADIATSTFINYILIDSQVPQLVYAGMLAEEY